MKETTAKYLILADSASDLPDTYLDGTGIAFRTVPLTIRADGREYVDDATLNTAELLRAVHASKMPCTSACPSPDDFRSQFGDADYVFIVTITSKLSGCYNSACLARELSERADTVHVVDSKATCGTEQLIVDKLRALIEEGLPYETIVERIEAYRDSVELLFVLQKFDNLIANGRMSKVAGFIANTLVIRPICKAEDGEIKIAKKTVGAKSAFSKLYDMTLAATQGAETKPIVISHCCAEDEAESLRVRFVSAGYTDVRVRAMRGLASFYALEQGVIVCFERNPE